MYQDYKFVGIINYRQLVTPNLYIYIRVNNSVTINIYNIFSSLLKLIRVWLIWWQSQLAVEE